MNGCKTVLVDRVLTADRNLTMDQRRTIFRDLESRRNTRRSRIEPNMQSIGAGAGVWTVDENVGPATHNILVYSPDFLLLFQFVVFLMLGLPFHPFIG